MTRFHAVPDGWRVRLAHTDLRLPGDGHRVGVSVAGCGVPLVFLHGIALNRRSYLRMLSRLPQLGFLVVAIDAAAHGDSDALPRDAAGFRERADLVARTLDALGIRRAVLLGHSMGGRTVVELSAAAPKRTLCAVLLAAGAGRSFDAVARGSVRTPRSVAAGLARVAYDTTRDRRGLPRRDRRSFRRSVLAASAASGRHPARVAATLQAIVRSGDSELLLRRMREAAVPTVVVHGERDLVVPVRAGHDQARATGGSLYVLPDAAHSWMLPNPYLAADVVRRLLAAELGAALRRAAGQEGLAWPPTAPAWQDALLTPDALLRELVPPHHLLGPAGGATQAGQYRLERREPSPAESAGVAS